MYNQLMTYNIPMQREIPYCPFMRPMYIMPDMMMRSEEFDDELDINLPDDVEEDLRENVNDNDFVDNIADTEHESNDSATEDIIEKRIEEDIDDYSININYDKNQFRSPENPEQILRMIERNNPMVIRRLVMYGIPYHVAINMVRRIIYLTLQYHR